MIDFLNDLLETAVRVPDRPAVVDRDGTRATTYRELLNAAFRVNAWLRNRGLGREDVCAIYFPKSMEYIASRIGIMMAGSAWVGLEDLMGAERIDFVIQNSGAKAVLNADTWAEAMRLPPCEEIAEPDMHDLAFIIYTSGSTGTPKGSAQEYGVYENISRGTSGFVEPYATPEPLRFADVAPQTFVAGIYTTVGVLSARGTIHEISMAMVRDIGALTRYFIEKEIHHTFMTPTFIRLLLKEPKIRLRAASTGGEIVSDVYTDRFDIYNVYGPSEFGFPTCLFRLDHAYRNTPIGTPFCGSDIVLLDDDGLPSDEGTFCIELPYFRGYIGESDESCYVTVNGKRYFRTSDYVKRDSRGRYTVLDRLDDMVKLNGNRVDTREVEAAVKRVLHTDFCCVRLYRMNGIKALCAYYTGDREIDSVSAARELRSHIPEYMIPSCYIRLQEIPLNANGKLNRRALPEPEERIRTAPYTPPENKMQERLCDVLKSGLDLKTEVGIDDDFFMLGGDSIRAMEVLAHCGIPGLTVQMVYEGRTVRRIMALLKETQPAPEAPGEPPGLAPLSINQQFLLRQDLAYPGTCMLNLPLRFNILPGADMEKLAGAVRVAVRSHPVLLSTIEERDGSLFLRYRPETEPSFAVESMPDDALEKEAAAFVRPFSLDGKPLFRCRLIRGEHKSILLMDVYHVICDGFSLKKLVTDIMAAWAGETPAADECFRLLREEAEYRAAPQFRRDMQYFAERYDHPGWDTVPRPDHESDSDEDEMIFRAFDFKQEDVSSLERKYGFGRSGLYIAAAALAIAACNGSEDVMFNWTWHGRSDDRRMNSVGLFFRDMPVAYRLKRGVLLSRLYEEIAAQVREGISHGNVSYWEEKGSYCGKQLTCLIYQGDVYEFRNSGSIVNSVEKLPLPYAACNNQLDIEILDGRDRFGILLDYNARKYEQSTMERFSRIFCAACVQMIRQNPKTATVGDVIRKATEGESI